MVLILIHYDDRDLSDILSQSEMDVDDRQSISIDSDIESFDERNRSTDLIYI